MKAIVLVVAFIAGVTGYIINVPTMSPLQPEDDSAPVAWVNKQKLMIPLFENVCEVSNDPTVIELANEFIVSSTSDDFTNSTALSHLHELESSKGFMAKGEIFTEYNSDNLYELKVVYELLYYAKNFDEFHKVAAWARQNLNCGLYINALYMAIEHRSDTEMLSMPAPYSLIPHYFVTQNVIYHGVYIAAGHNVNETQEVHVEGNVYTIDANYTDVSWENDEETKLAYFREDIGLNSYYFLKKNYLAPWFNVDINGRYGEDLYHMMKQLMARYNLERYSNGLPELSDFSWNATINDIYDPMLIYTNGNKFTHRTVPLNLPDYEDVALLQTMENNIGTFVYHMMETGYNKTQILNHLMAILVTSDRSYETLARRRLGKDYTDNGSPSVLEHYMTSLRDPVFWKINYKIVNIIDGALKLLPPYTKHEIFFPGVEIVNVDMKKMITSFDDYVFDVTDALKINSNNTYQIKVGQSRLNHKPFTIKITISSMVPQKGLVKIFLGPKLIPGEFVSKKNLFVLLDQFNTTLKIGSNVITRTSGDMNQFSDDFLCVKMLRQKIQDAEFGLPSKPKTIKSQIGYPSRLILPKGTSQGLPLQLFVFIAPYTKVTIGEFYTIVKRDFNSAILSPSYPLDLTIQDPLLLEIPNAILKDIIVSHKGDSKVENYGGAGVTKKWYGDDNYDPSSRPNYSANKNKPFDYNSIKSQYGKNNNYLIKSNEHIMSESEVKNENLNNNEDQNEYVVPAQNLKLLTSSFDDALKRKELFDYKSIKEQYGKKKDKYPHSTSKSVDDSLQNEYNSTSHKVTTDNEPKYHQDSEEILQVSDEVQSLEIKPVILQISIPKKRSTVYDYIFNGLYNDSSEEKVYEKK